MQVEYIDIIQTHDIEFGDIEQVLFVLLMLKEGVVSTSSLMSSLTLQEWGVSVGDHRNTPGAPEAKRARAG